jgi:hypothetical protein
MSEKELALAECGARRSARNRMMSAYPNFMQFHIQKPPCAQEEEVPVFLREYREALAAKVATLASSTTTGGAAAQSTTSGQGGTGTGTTTGTTGAVVVRPPRPASSMIPPTPAVVLSQTARTDVKNAYTAQLQAQGGTDAGDPACPNSRKNLNPLSISANPLRDDPKKNQNPPGNGLFEGGRASTQICTSLVIEGPVTLTGSLTWPDSNGEAVKVMKITCGIEPAALQPLEATLSVRHLLEDRWVKLLGAGAGCPQFCLPFGRMLPSVVDPESGKLLPQPAEKPVRTNMATVLRFEAPVLTNVISFPNWQKKSDSGAEGRAKFLPVGGTLDPTNVQDRCTSKGASNQALGSQRIRVNIKSAEQVRLLISAMMGGDAPASPALVVGAKELSNDGVPRFAVRQCSIADSLVPAANLNMSLPDMGGLKKADKLMNDTLQAVIYPSTASNPTTNNGKSPIIRGVRDSAKP